MTSDDGSTAAAADDGGTGVPARGAGHRRDAGPLAGVELVAVAAFGVLVAARGHGPLATVLAAGAWLPQIVYVWWFAELPGRGPRTGRPPVATRPGGTVTRSALVPARREQQARAVAGAVTAAVAITAATTSAADTDDWVFDPAVVIGLLVLFRGLFRLHTLRRLARRALPQVTAVVRTVGRSWQDRVLLDAPGIVWSADRRGVLCDVEPGDVVVLHVDADGTWPALATVGARHGLLFGAQRVSSREQAGAASSS